MCQPYIESAALSEILCSLLIIYVCPSDFYNDFALLNFYFSIQ